MCHNSVRIQRLGALIGGEYITIGENSDIQQYTYLTAWGGKSCPSIEIGSDCYIGAFNHISCVNKIVICSGFVSGKWVTITDNSHGEIDYSNMKNPVSSRKIVSKGPVIIGKNVWLGDKVTILPGVEIGEGSIIAANSVVTKNIPSYCVAGGIPAKIIKKVI